MVSFEAVDRCLINVIMPAKTIENKIIAVNGLIKPSNVPKAMPVKAPCPN